MATHLSYGRVVIGRSRPEPAEKLVPLPVVVRGDTLDRYDDGGSEGLSEERASLLWDFNLCNGSDEPRGGVPDEGSAVGDKQNCQTGT